MKLGAELFYYKGRSVPYYYAITDTDIHVTFDDGCNLTHEEEKEIEGEIKAFLRYENK